MAKDIYHKIVAQALTKAGWQITHDPYYITRTSKKSYEVDLGAERIIAAEKGIDKIAVEVKSFIGSSITYDFHAAFGQYGIYRFLMENQEPERILFLAISQEVYEFFFEDVDIKNICQHFKIQIIVFNQYTIEIVSWIKNQDSI